MSWTADPGARLALAAHVLIGSLRFCIGEGNRNPLQYSCLQNPRDGGTCWAAVYGVAQSRTRLKRLSSSSRFCPARGGPLTLQARMTCWCEEDGHISGSWQFSFNGQMCLVYDSENGHWTEVHPGGRQMKEKWKKDRAVTDFFKNISKGNCQAWLHDFMVPWEKFSKTTASPTTGPPRFQSMATAIKSKAWILPVVLTSFIITVFLG